jgi:hypothetical protein
MPSTSPNTIKLKKYLDIINEYEANATITPGMLIELMSTGKVRAHSTSGGNAVRMFALEDELQGNGIDDNYSAADRVQCWNAVPGEEVYAILADGETIAIGDFLESNGAGLLQKHTSDVESFESAEAGSITVYPEQIVAQALEAIDMSGSSGTESSGDLTADHNKRIKVRIV